MDSAIVAFHSIRDNLKLKGRLGLDQGLPEDPGSEFVSEYSQDFNSVDSDTCRKGILKARSKYVQDTLVIPPEILEKISNKDQFFHSGRNTRARDSGFNSEYNSSVLASEKGSCVYYPDQNSNAFESEQGSNVFGSEQPSVGPSEAPSAIFGSELGSNYLEHYGLDGPLEVYTPLPATSPPPP
ncbi:uncharacterized protein LOC111702774, partial [Eurytemora carolleeae]|uniref:uncharacterized protein LOC111702774 n=1 Tax=Eurytemora carolleeae TaxID=1294199 RepID=UPI000C772D6A